MLPTFSVASHQHSTHTHTHTRIAGLSHIGTVEKGKRADLLLLNEELNLQQTIIAGQTEFKKYHHETDYEP